MARCAAALVVLAPWALFILYSTWPVVLQSIGQLEAFPESGNPGYFLIKVALFLLALLVLLQAAIGVFREDA